MDRKRTATLDQAPKHKHDRANGLVVEAPASPRETDKEFSRKQLQQQALYDSGEDSDPSEHLTLADMSGNPTGAVKKSDAADGAVKQMSHIDRSEWSADDEQNDSLETVLFVSKRFRIEPVAKEVPIEQLPVGLLAATRGELDDVHIDPAVRDIALAAAAATPSVEIPSGVAGSSATVVTGVQPENPAPAAAGGRPVARRCVVHPEEVKHMTMSIRSRANEYKKYMADYYAALDQKFPERSFRFDVLIGKDRRKRKLLVDLSAGGITRFKRDGRRKKTYIAFKELLQVVKSTRDPLMAVLRLRNGKMGMVRFPTMVDRERFYSVCWLGQCNFFASKTIAPREEPVSLYVGTFNMAGEDQVEPPELWLGSIANDIVAICAQECNDSEFRKLIAPLNRSHVMVDFVSILYVKLAVFVRRRHIPKIRSVQHSHVATGIANVVGNKGAVAISFSFDDSSFCFVGSHLAPHDKNLEERNKQFSAIVRQLKLGVPLCDILDQFDHVIWCGDLNYRVPLKPDVSLPLIKEGNFAPLLEADQLTQARKNKEAFTDFAEGRISFPPTFKLSKGDPKNKKQDAEADEDEEKEKEKKKKKKKKLGKIEEGYVTKRNPSWCDRVLWKSSPAASPLKLLEYHSSNLFVASDHNPVHAIFRTRLLLPVEPSLTVPLIISFKDTLSISELRWAGGSESGGAAPNVVLIFKAPFIDSTQTYYSNIKQESFSPVWEEGEIADIPTCVCDPRYLSQRSLTVLIYHFDSAFQGIIGRCVIPLGDPSLDLSETSVKGIKFTTRITLHGKPAGVLSGTVCVFPSAPSK